MHVSLDPLEGNYGFDDNEHFGGQGENDDEWVEHLEGGGDGHPHVRDELWSNMCHFVVYIFQHNTF